MDTLSGEATLSKLFLSSCENRSALKGNSLFPLGVNSFLLEEITFQKDIDVQESKQEIIKFASLVNKAEILPCVSSPLKVTNLNISK